MGSNKQVTLRVGERFGKLEIIQQYGWIKRRLQVLCRCDCGNTLNRQYDGLVDSQRRGVIQSCGKCGGRMLDSESAIGMQFGRLTVVDESWGGPRGQRLVTCTCSCDGKRVGPRLLYRLILWKKRGSVSSCGCYRHEMGTKHGMAGTPTYSSWHSIIMRCTNPDHPAFRNYGARGISFCKEWTGPRGFVNFLRDMGERPSLAYECDRKNNNDGYYPSNCRWATDRENANNTRRNIHVLFEDTDYTLSNLARHLTLPYGKLVYQFKRTGSIDTAIERVRSLLASRIH